MNRLRKYVEEMAGRKTNRAAYVMDFAALPDYPDQLGKKIHRSAPATRSSVIPGSCRCSRRR
jgi:hypothetical protein